MVEGRVEKKTTKKVTLSESDVCTLMQRYPASSILTVLREVAQSPEVEINWKALLDKTSSCGFKTPLELQLLWRHLAYRHPLSSSNPDGDVNDSDSDLDIELEADLAVTSDVALDASNCVRLLSSGSLTDTNFVDLDTPNSHPQSKLPSSSPPPPPPLQPTSVLPVPSQLASPTGQAQGQGGVGVDPNASRKKRKWSDDDDSKLAACVTKLGETNWLAVQKEGFSDRTPAQLSHRWTTMRKKQATANLAAPPPTSTSQQLSEAQLATRRALDMAFKDNLTVVGNGAAGTTNPSKTKSSNVESAASTVPTTATMSTAPTATISSGPSQRQAVPGSSVVKTARPVLKKAAAKPPSISDTIQRTAVAAGARIVNPLDADFLRNSTNVRFFRTGTAPVSVGSGLIPFPNKDTTVKASSQPTVAVSQVPKSKNMPNEHLTKKDDKPCPAVNVSCSEAKQVVRVPENNARCLPKAQSMKNRSTSPGGLPKITTGVGVSKCAVIKGNSNPVNGGKDETSKQVVPNPVKLGGTDHLSAASGSCAPGDNDKLPSLSNTIVDPNKGKMDC